MKKTQKKTEKKNIRPEWDQYFMAIADVIAARSNCSRRHVAAIIVKDKRIISTGYNGTPRGIKNCDEGGCPRCASDAPSGHNLRECICCHGEENAIVQAACHGISVKDAAMYSTYCPCLLCAKMIINSGIKEVVYRAKYHMDHEAEKLLRSVNIIVRQIK